MTIKVDTSTLLDLLQQAHLIHNAFLQDVDESERTTIGTLDRWSAKDHIAHITFWRQSIMLKLAAVLRKETPSNTEDFEQLNIEVFEAQKERPWSAVLAEAEQAYKALTNLIHQLSEEELFSPHRFDWVPDGEPLYTIILENSFEHARAHYSQYYLERHNLPQATGINESLTRIIIQANVSDVLKGTSLYNLACFYATNGRLEEALALVQQAFMLNPYSKEYALTDSDLDALRDQLPSIVKNK